MRKTRTDRVGEEAMETFDMERGGATDDEVALVTTRTGKAILGVRSAMVMQGLSEGRYTALDLVDFIGCELNVVADAARELVEAGLATERTPGTWRLTKNGWDRVHDPAAGE